MLSSLRKNQTVKNLIASVKNIEKIEFVKTKCCSLITIGSGGGKTKDYLLPYNVLLFSKSRKHVDNSCLFLDIKNIFTVLKDLEIYISENKI